MRLTALLFRRNLMPNGNIFRGKDRLVKKVEPKHLRRLQQDFAIEEQNMLYLRHPYLTEEQSRGHAKALNKHQNRRDAFQEKSRRVFKEDITLFERLLHLRSNEDWDVYKK